MSKLINDDCLKAMKGLKDNSIDFVFADPPYFLSNGGVSYSSGKVVSVDKGDWDKSNSREDDRSFTELWMVECLRLLKPGGGLVVTGTHHNIFDVGYIGKNLGYKVVNFITWNKSDPPPLIYKNKLRFSTEHLIWFKKHGKHYFNYNAAFKINECELTDVWKLDSVKLWEKKHGKHPTMKPEKLLERIIKIMTKPGNVILDPFMGSGTTCVVSKKLSRHYIGMEKEKKYFDIANRRVMSTK